MHVSKKTAVKVIYWNAVFAVIIVCLGLTFSVRRIHRYDEILIKTGRQYNVDPRLLSALIWTESRFNPASIGDAGEIGLMQVTETAAREWAEAEEFDAFQKNDLFDPSVNVRAGTWYLSQAIQRWSHKKDPLPFALAEYNAGRSNALRWSENINGNARDFWEAITYPTTQRYIRDILTRYRGGI